jgi:non-ribosomal peptide synthetase component F
LWERFALVAKQHADQTAVTMDEAQVSYRTLAGQAETIAASLVPHNAGPEALVAILTERTPTMVAAMLGVIRSGAAYLPIDPKTPHLRVREVIDDARPVAILTDRGHAASFADRHTPLLIRQQSRPHPAPPRSTRSPTSSTPPVPPASPRASW